MKEEAERKKKAEEDAKTTPVEGKGGAKGKPDPKKDKGKPAGKGAAPTEDKNAPQQITVEYPETAEDQNCMIMERTFMEAPE